MKKIKFFLKEANNYFIDGYKANKIIFIILAIITNIYKRKTNIRTKIRLINYIVYHNKGIKKLYFFLSYLFIWFMFLFKYDTEFLNSISFEDYSFECLNKKFYKRDIQYNYDFNSYDLKKHSLFLFLCIYYFYNKLYFWYAIEDEIFDTNLDYKDYKNIIK